MSELEIQKEYERKFISLREDYRREISQLRTALNQRERIIGVEMIKPTTNYSTLLKVVDINITMEGTYITVEAPKE